MVLKGFGKAIQAVRLEKHLLQKDIATRLGFLDDTSISRIEAGKRNVSLYEVLRIAQALDMKFDDLVRLALEKNI